MKSTENQADVNLLEVHQMAVDNAIRQQENRQAIARLRIDHERDVQDLRKDAAESKLNIDTFLSKAEKHLDRAAELQEEIRQILSETAQKQSESGVDMEVIEKKLSETAQILSETAQMQRKSGVDIEEIKKLQRETAQNRRESGVDIEEIKKLQRETTQQMKETDRKIKELSTRFSSTTGHIIEGLMSSSAIKMYEDKGFKINSLCKNYKRKNKQLNLEMEQDVVLFTDTQVIVEEVKASCDKKDVDKFFRNMEMFKLLYDEYADKEVLGAVAAVNYEDGADTYARNLGLFVVRVSSDDIFSLDPFKMEELKRF